MAWDWQEPRTHNGHHVPHLRELDVCLDDDHLWPVTLHFELRHEFEVWFVTMIDPDTGRTIEVSEALYPARDAEFDQYLWDKWCEIIDDYCD